MYVIEVKNNQKHVVRVEEVDIQDYKRIIKSRYYFNWKTENQIYKLILQDDILGLMSILNDVNDKRLEINLLAVSKENRGKNKQFDRIAGTLIGFACREAKKHYGIEACVSLVPKTQLKRYYINKYQMADAGRQVFLAGQALLNVLKEYEL